MAYSWMCRQMVLRLPPAPKGCVLPVWAWYQARDAARPRPDLRTSGHLPRGTKAVLLTLALPEDQVLLSDFDLWHAILNNHAIPDAATERRDKAGGLDREASWNRIFDLDFAAPGIAEPRAGKIIQATFWELPFAAISQITAFTAR
ncbi:MAG: DUF3841 domain-containing protein [Tabrizicola sp.]|nr:DUF3841 domain-containing protein [Tabrizicola sp.]